MRIHALLLFVIILMAILMVHGSVQATQGAIQETDTYRPTATIKDIMQAMVDPSADYIWDAVATEVSATGARQRFPQNDKEWAELRKRTITLIEATNLLAMPGRHVAKAGDKSANPPIELEPDQIEALINMDRKGWIDLAHGLHDASMQVLAAVDKKDLPAILSAGATIDQACENCHVKYWYPNSRSRQPGRP